MPCYWGAVCESTRVGKEAEEAGKLSKRLDCFHGKEQADLGLASLGNISGFWGIGAVPSYLVLGPGVIRAGR